MTTCIHGARAEKGSRRYWRLLGTVTLLLGGLLAALVTSASQAWAQWATNGASISVRSTRSSGHWPRSPRPQWPLASGRARRGGLTSRDEVISLGRDSRLFVPARAGTDCPCIVNERPFRERGPRRCKSRLRRVNHWQRWHWDGESRTLGKFGCRGGRITSGWRCNNRWNRRVRSYVGSRRESLASKGPRGCKSGFRGLNHG